MQDFKDCNVNSGLGHISTVGPLFTWTNKRPTNPIFRQLDRMLGNKEWFTTFTEVVLLVKPRGIMDYNPFMFTVPMDFEKSQKPFQFFNFMKDIVGFEESVRKV